MEYCLARAQQPTRRLLKKIYNQDIKMLIRFQDILLEPEQEDLFSLVVEASRTLSRNQREKFILVETVQGSFLRHAYLHDFVPDVYKGDVEALHRVGLIYASYESSTLVFDVTPEGFRYYEYLKERKNEPIARVESHSRSYLDGGQFQKLYPSAFQKWAEAETLLWSSDSEKQLTTIGHLCREATQEFATALVEKHRPPNVDPIKAHDVARIRSVINNSGAKLGDTTTAFLEALVIYWGTLSDLIQRQEHGSQREGQQLVWEDARRIVFQTISIFVEIDRALTFHH